MSRRCAKRLVLLVEADGAGWDTNEQSGAYSGASSDVIWCSKVLRNGVDLGDTVG
jgi:hypothetical protein